MEESATGRFRRIAEAEGLTGKMWATARSLKPPPSDDPQVRAWRYFIVAITVTNSLSIAGHIALACGLTPFFGGFAIAADTRVAAAEVKQARVEFIEARLFDLRVAQCQAIKRGDNPQAFTIQLQQQWQRFREVTGRDPQIPTCAELGS